jgi:hypothetical protein
MPEQLQVPQPLYTQNMKTKGNNYFFDIRAAKNGHKFLCISESWISKDGQKHHSSITVFQDNLGEFKQAVEELAEKVKTV